MLAPALWWLLLLLLFTFCMEPLLERRKEGEELCGWRRRAELRACGGGGALVEAERSRRWGGASWRAMLWLMDWLMQDAAKDLLNAEEMGEGQGGFWGGGAGRAEGGAGGGVLAPGEPAGSPADEGEGGAESRGEGPQAEGSGSLSWLGVLEAWRSGFLEAAERKIKSSREQLGPAAPWGAKVCSDSKQSAQSRFPHTVLEPG